MALFFLLALSLGALLRLLLSRRLELPILRRAYLLPLALVQAVWLILLSLAGLIPAYVAGPLSQLGAYLLLFYFALVNRHLPALWPALLGSFLDALVIVANRGYMPMDPLALERAGFERFLSLLEHSGDGFHVLSGPDTPLRLLGGWIALPGWVATPGDLLLLLSAFLLPLLPRWQIGRAPTP